MSYERQEFYFSGHQDLRLYAQEWIPQKPYGTAIITHGQGEHCECYQRLIQALSPLNLRFVSWDLRGHGRSDGLRGFASNFNEYCLDFQSLMQHLLQQKNFSQEPVLLIAHSMGALVQLRSLLSFPEFAKVQLQVISGPLLGLNKKIPAWKDWGSIAMNLLTPQMTTWNEIKDEDCSQDPQVLSEYKSDIYRHQRISPAVYLGFYESWRFVKERAKFITTPTLIQIAENDPVVSSPKAQEFYTQLKCEKELKKYPHRKHEIFNDIERNSVFLDTLAFIKKYSMSK